MAGGLDGRIALITGAGSGLGAAFATRLAADGAYIVVNDVNADAAKRTAEAVSGEAVVFDVTDSAAVDTNIDDVVRRHGRLDICVNNAGIAESDPEVFNRSVANQIAKMEGREHDIIPVQAFSSITDERWDKMIKTHLYGTFYVSRAAVRRMEAARSGVIVNISSILGVSPSSGSPHYGAAKAAIASLTRSLAGELAAFGVRVNALCPGFIDTPLLDFMDPMMRAMVTMRIGMGRMGRPEEMAEVVRFLVGDESSYMTGEIITASGNYN